MIEAELSTLGSIEDQLTWCEVDIERLSHNIMALKAHLPQGCLLAPAVKSNGYGHGLNLVARAFVRGGADWLCVHTLKEAAQLRTQGFTCPIYLFGPTLVSQIARAVTLGLDLVVYQRAHIIELQRLAQQTSHPVNQLGIHLKIETGNHRQGVSCEEAVELVHLIKQTPALRLAGVTSHFANIEDTSDHSFAEQQLTRLQRATQRLSEVWGQTLYQHMANSAASLLWPERAMSIARVGIASYGLWPSTEVRALVHSHLSPRLKPALSWKTRIAQVKQIDAGEPIGYGCTYITTRPTLLAILPVGYFEGYDRGISNRGEVLVRGHRAQIRGRICMNMCMIDVTEIPDVMRGDVVTLIGCDGDQEVTAEEVAEWSDTINYEVVSRIAPHVPRYPV